MSLVQRLLRFLGLRAGAPTPVDCTTWRQADVFTGRSIEMRKGDAVMVEDALSQVAVVSQSCDAAQPTRPEIQLAPVILLEEGKAQEAKAGKRTRYAHLAALGDNFFADLAIMVTIDKARLTGVSRQRGVLEDADVRRFAGSTARRFGRYPFPDVVVACLEPMRKALASKARKPNSPLGKVLANVYSLRVEVAGNWSDHHRDLTLIVILQAGALPLTDDPPSEPNGLRSDMSAGAIINTTKVAERLLSSGDEAVRCWCWILLAEAWAEECQRRATEWSLTDHVRRFLQKSSVRTSSLWTASTEVRPSISTTSRPLFRVIEGLANCPTIECPVRRSPRVVIGMVLVPDPCQMYRAAGAREAPAGRRSPNFVLSARILAWDAAPRNDLENRCVTVGSNPTPSASLKPNDSRPNAIRDSVGSPRHDAGRPALARSTVDGSAGRGHQAFRVGRIGRKCRRAP